MEHGTLGTWARDGAVAGAVTAIVGWGLSIGVILVLLTGSPQWDRLLAIVSATLVGASVLGAAAWSVGWWLVVRSRGLALAAVPAVAGLTAPLLALASLAPVVGAYKVSTMPLEVWLLSVGFGAVAVGPPWMAYVAVRIRGRSGLPVVLASVAWVVVPVGLMFAGLYAAGRM
ncbi:MAG: hypothetical protein H6738_25630 [Alphaproteobacteria bacterium]|nr:hypothetical protein [Alphaproteobacteria bacterium]MCB9700193.1 hypothetical protein [Alphaproteobacteria bacterium]